MTIKLRDRAVKLNKVKNINSDMGEKQSNFDFLENEVSLCDQDHARQR